MDVMRSRSGVRARAPVIDKLASRRQRPACPTWSTVSNGPQHARLSNNQPTMPAPGHWMNYSEFQPAYSAGSNTYGFSKRNPPWRWDDAAQREPWNALDEPVLLRSIFLDDCRATFGVSQIAPGIMRTLGMDLDQAVTFREAHSSRQRSGTLQKLMDDFGTQEVNIL